MRAAVVLGGLTATFQRFFCSFVDRSIRISFKKLLLNVRKRNHIL